jgi:hypothetical protein
MDRLPSAKFRKTYPTLTESVAVTALGRVIGHYVPISVAIDDRFLAGLRPGEPASWDALAPRAARNTTKTQQGERDAILRKINRGG